MIQLVCVSVVRERICMYYRLGCKSVYLYIFMPACVCVCVCVCVYHCLTESQGRIICRMFQQCYRTTLRVLFQKWHPERCVCVFLCVCVWEKKKREKLRVGMIDRKAPLSVTERALGCTCLMHIFVYTCMLLAPVSSMCMCVSTLNSVYERD